MKSIRTVNGIRKSSQHNKIIPKPISDDSFASIGIPGCSDIINPQKSTFFRLLWAIIVITCIGAFLTNAVNSLLYFLNQDPEVKLEYKSNETVEFPSLIICPTYFYFNPAVTEDIQKNNKSSILLIDAVFSFIESEEVNLSRLWFDTGKYIEKLNGYFIQGVSVLNTTRFSNQTLNKREIYSSTGRCQYFSTDAQLKEGSSCKIFHYNYTRIAKQYITILAYSKDSSSLLQYLHIYKAISIGLGQFTNFVYEATEKRRINARKKPCLNSEEVEKCKLDCLEDYLYSHLKIISHCRLPNMNPREELPICNHLQFKRMYTAYEKFIVEFDEEKCQCPRKCREVVFDIRYSNFQDVHGNITIIYINILKKISLETEFWPYSFANFLSDLGGFLGLFLGICILSFVQIFIALISQFKNGFAKFQKKIFAG